MTKTEALQKIVDDLIEVMHLQARELEKLVTHIEQVTTRLPEAHRFSLVASELSALHQRIKHCGSAAAKSTP